MPSKERLYIMRTPDGEEYGPVDQDALVRWAESGRISSNCEIRSTLLNRWEKAHTVAFLRDILVDQISVTEQRVKEGFFRRLRRRASVKSSNVTRHAVKKSQVSEYKSATLWARIGAAVIDIICVGIWAVIVYLSCALIFSLRILGPNECFYLGFVVFYMGMFAYFLWTLVYTAQTMGQRFTGIILLRNSGGQVFSGRAFFFTIFLILFGPLTPLFALFNKSKRALHEILTDTRMVRMKLVGKRY